jgi:hypothetical protein
MIDLPSRLILSLIERGAPAFEQGLADAQQSGERRPTKCRSAGTALRR